MSLSEIVKEHITAPPSLPSAQPTISAWQEPPHPEVSSIQSKDLPTETDIVIIGSGVTGCGVAHTLLNHPDASDLRITILEARGAVSGATGRNGGHLVSNAAELAPYIAETLGVEEAVKVIRFSEATISRLRGIIDSLDDNDRAASEYRAVISTMGYKDEESFAEAKAAIEFLESIGPSTGILEHKVLPVEEAIEKYHYRNIVGAAEQLGAAALWPYRLFTAVYKALLAKHQDRFTLETNTPVLSIDYLVDPSAGEQSYVLKTPRESIKAQKVIHCTNGYASYLIPNLVGKLYPIRGTMSVQKASPSFPQLGDKVSWSYSGKRSIDPETTVADASLYYVQQNVQTGDIWIGGEVQPVPEFLNSDDSKVGELARENLTSIMPKIFDDEGSTEEPKVWSGIMGFTADGLPLVGKLPEELTGRAGNGEWIAAGYSGHGMDKGWLCGETIARMTLGEQLSSSFPRSFLVSEDRLEHLTVEMSVQGLLATMNAPSSEV